VAPLGGSALGGGSKGPFLLTRVQVPVHDRNDPLNPYRPSASGYVPYSVAVHWPGALYLLAVVISWRLTPLFFELITLYVGQNFLYSVGLKEYLFVDLFSISAGFVIRAVAGIVLVSVELSPWILLCTFLAALMLGVSKRWGESRDVEDPAAIRTTLDDYSPQTLQFLLGSVATMLLMAYALYTFFARDLLMMLTIPFAFYAVFRFVHLTFVREGASEPAALLLDRGLLVNFTLWGLITLPVIYHQQLGVGL